MLDQWDIEHYTKEFAEYAEKENGFGSSLYCMSNEPFSEELYTYFKKFYPELKLWKTPRGQNITFGKKGEMELASKIHQRIAELKNLIKDYESIIEELPESIPIFD